MTENMIIDAYCRIRTIDNTIPDDVLGFMKNAAIEKLRKNLNPSDTKQRSIAVLSSNTNDFQAWKRDNNIKPTGVDKMRRFTVGNTTYHCISNVSDLCAINLDDIIETEHAKDNEEYEQMISVAQDNLNAAYKVNHNTNSI